MSKKVVFEVKDEEFKLLCDALNAHDKGEKVTSKMLGDKKKLIYMYALLSASGNVKTTNEEVK